MVRVPVEIGDGTKNVWKERRRRVIVNLVFLLLSVRIFRCLLDEIVPRRRPVLDSLLKEIGNRDKRYSFLSVSPDSFKCLDS